MAGMIQRYVGIKLFQFKKRTRHSGRIRLFFRIGNPLCSALLGLVLLGICDMPIRDHISKLFYPLEAQEMLLMDQYTTWKDGHLHIAHHWLLDNLVSLSPQTRSDERCDRLLLQYKYRASLRHDKPPCLHYPCEIWFLECSLDLHTCM